METSMCAPRLGNCPRCVRRGICASDLFFEKGETGEEKPRFQEATLKVLWVPLSSLVTVVCVDKKRTLLPGYMMYEI